ncbi:MAG: hypothetical protein L7V85_08390 [Bacteroidia bacterium]|nr:hypothetical protein [Bacteroidia bacterium]
MICDNKLTIRCHDNKSLHDIEDLFTVHLKEYDTFSELVYSKILKGDFSLIKMLPFTQDIVDTAQELEEVASIDFNNLFGTRWIDVINTEVDYNDFILKVDFDSHWTPPLAMTCFIAQAYDVQITHEAIESTTDKAYYMKANSIVDYTIDYMTYYEFYYKIKNDIECLEQLFVFYETFDDFISGITKDNILLTGKEHLYLQEKYNELDTSKLEKL